MSVSASVSSAQETPSSTPFRSEVAAAVDRLQPAAPQPCERAPVPEWRSAVAIAVNDDDGAREAAGERTQRPPIAVDLAHRGRDERLRVRLECPGDPVLDPLPI